MLKIALLLLSQLAYGQVDKTWQGSPVDKWCGLNTFYDSSQIDECDAQDAQNVFTDGGSLEKRPGNVRLAQILDGFAIKFVGEWIAPSATRYLIAHSSDSVYQTDLGAAAVAIGTVAVDSNIDVISAYQKLIVQDGSSAPFFWNGTSTETNNGMPICSYMEFSDERVYCASIPSESSSRVRVSSFGSINYFTVPSNVSSVADAPNTFDFQKDDGEAITCLKVTPWGKVVGKPHSMHILKGYDNSTYYKRIVDPKIGCLSDRTVQMVDGVLVWLSLDGIYSWSGSGPPSLISKDIEPLVNSIRQLNSQASQWVIDTMADFQTGTSSLNGPTAAWSMTLVPASIVPSSSTFIDTSSTNFTAGTLAMTNSTHTAGSLELETVLTNIGVETVGTECEIGTSNDITGWTCSGTDLSASGDFFRTALPTSCTAPSWAGSKAASRGCISGADSTASMVVDVLNGSNDAVIYSRTHTSTTDNCVSQSIATSTQTVSTFKLRFTATDGAIFTSDAFQKIDEVAYYVESDACIPSTNHGEKFDFPEPFFARSGTFTSRSFDTSFATPTFNVPVVTISSSSARMLTLREQASADGSSWDTSVSWTPGVRPASKKRYWRYVATFGSSKSTESAALSELGTLVAIGTGTYDSAVHFIGSNISSWKAFNATESQDGGLTYYVRSATYSFPSNSAIAWTAQTNNTTISISTGSYYQFRVDSTNVYNSTDNAQVLRVATNWQEGSDKQLASGVDDHSYFLCAQISTSATTNDACLVFQRNNKWTKWSSDNLPSSMGVFNNNLIIGDAETNSYVWKIMQSDVYSDDGAAINAYWISKDFHYEKPFQQKVLHEIWIDSAYQSSSTLTIGYATNRSDSFSSKTINLDSVSSISNRRIPLTAGFVLGKYLRFKLSNATIDNQFRVNRFMPLIELKDRIPE